MNIIFLPRWLEETFFSDPISLFTIFFHFPFHPLAYRSPPPQHRSPMIFLRRFPRHSLLRWTVTVLRAGGQWCTSCTSPSLPVLRSFVLFPSGFSSSSEPSFARMQKVGKQTSLCSPSSFVCDLLLLSFAPLYLLYLLCCFGASVNSLFYTVSLFLHRATPPFLPLLSNARCFRSCFCLI